MFYLLNKFGFRIITVFLMLTILSNDAIGAPKIKAPTITSFAPSSGAVGTTVTVSGSNFSSISVVKLNAVNQNFTVVSTTKITFVVSANAGTGRISVTNSAGTAISSANFTVISPLPSIASFSPTSGGIGTTVTVTGTNFSGATALTLGGLSTSFTIVNATTISFVVPAGAISGSIGITNPYGTATSATVFNVVNVFPPSITSVTPLSGQSGTTVSLNGTNFSNASSVKLNGMNVAFTIVSGTQITFVVPANATSGNITVTNSDGTATGPVFTVITPVIVRGAYMVCPMSDNITIQWRTDIPSNSEVRYGLSSGSLTNVVNSASSVSDHTVRLTGLNPNTQYYYSIGIIGNPLQSGANNYFYTAPADTTSESTRFWVTGDFGNNSTNQRNVLTAFQNYNVDPNNPTKAWIWLGDNAYSNGTDLEYQTNVFNVYGTLFQKLPLLPELGNHDYGQTGYCSATSLGTTAPYFGIFSIPTNSTTEKYYSLNYGNVHFIGLDSYGSYNNSGSTMYNWLVNDLSNNTLPWVVVYWHHAPYTKGSHNSDTEIELIDMRNNINPLLEQYGVDLVLGGHSHIYERSKFIKGHYGLSTSFNSGIYPAGNVVQSATNNFSKSTLRGDGTVYTVCGVSGQSGGSTTSGYPHPAMQVSTTTNNGSLILDIGKTTLSCKYLTTAGVIFDEFTISKNISTPNAQNAESSIHCDYYDFNGKHLGNQYQALPANKIIIEKIILENGPHFRKIIKSE